MTPSEVGHLLLFLLETKQEALKLTAWPSNAEHCLLLNRIFVVGPFANELILSGTTSRWPACAKSL